MSATQVLKRLMMVAIGLQVLTNDPDALRNRQLWFPLFDELDALKGDLESSRGRAWPQGVLDTYIRVRTGMLEIFQILFGRPARPPFSRTASDVYCERELTAYYRRLAVLLARFSPATADGNR